VKVAVVLPELDPRIGGGFTFQESLAAALDRIRGKTHHEFVIYARGGDGPGSVRLPSSRSSLAARRLVRLTREVQERAFGIRPLSGRTWFERSLDREEIDLVWFGTPRAEDCRGRPFLFTIWDLEHLEQPWFPEVSANGEWELRQVFYSRYVPRATRIIVPNDAGREQVLRHFHIRPERILVLPHPTPEFAQRAAAASDSPGRPGLSGPYLLYPAQYWPHKNHATLLRALRELPEYTLVCAGSDKGYLGHVRRLATEVGVLDRVRFLGFVPTDELVGLYRGAHALMYMSFFGPENLPPLEAFALGCPVVQADVPGAREQLGDAALLVPSTDAQAAAEAVRRLEDPAIRTRQIEAGRECAAGYTADGYVQGVIEFLDEFEPVRSCWP
jgi:glycosyltransferase involved in cell wall biosynthesis